MARGSPPIQARSAFLVSTFRPLTVYPPTVPLPETIPVRYTEEEAGYVTVRPLVRQTFRLNELLDMILSVSGKDVARVRQLLHSGTVVYHFYRYSWTGFDADEAELATALAQFPDDDPSRPFDASQCTNALFETGGANPTRLLDLNRAMASKRRIFRGQSFWARLLEIAAEEKPVYEKYSYGRRADLYRLDLDGENVIRIEQAADHLAPGNLRSPLKALQSAAWILFVCPRPSGVGQTPPR